MSPVLILGLVMAGGFALQDGLVGMGWQGLFGAVNIAVVIGPFVGLVVGMNNGGWFVLLQRVAHRRLARAGKLPSRSDDFLDWGIGKQIFRRVGSGVRFRHDVIQQHLVDTSQGAT